VGGRRRLRRGRQRRHGGSGFGGTGGSEVGGSGGGTTCSDTGTEPNNTEAAAVNRPGINDCDGGGSSVAGVINGSGDADWFKFLGDDDVLCSVNPYAVSSAVNVGAAVRLRQLRRRRDRVQELQGAPRTSPPACKAAAPRARPTSSSGNQLSRHA
jgi:hypothetical protein